jgi:3-(3-hydroxy-phenyl)propionate hydroxylase
VVLDRWKSVYPQPRAVHLDDEVYRILGRLGVAEEFARITIPSEGLRLLDHRHNVLAQFSRGGLSPRSGYPRANMFDQPDLETLLRQRMHSLPAVDFRGDVEVTGVHEIEGGVAEVRYEDRITGAASSVAARYVLGCDGANSVVRSAIGSTMQDLDFEQRWLVIDIVTQRDLAQWEGVHQVCDTRRAATYMRVAENRYRWEFQLLPEEDAGAFTTLADVEDLIRPWTGTIPLKELELVRVAEYTFRAQIADRWRKGNIFILGDAAHLTPPFIGQGMGAGLRDAQNLAWKIRGVLDGRLEESVLDSYEAERMPHARTIIRLAKLVGVLMTSGGTVGDLLRRLLAPRVAVVPFLGAKVLDSETAPLRRNLWARRGWRDPLAGRLAPNEPLLDGNRLDTASQGDFLVVSTAPIPAASAQALFERHCQSVVVPASSPLGQWLRSGRAEAALVRPDAAVLASGSAEKIVTETTGILRPLR